MRVLLLSLSLSCSLPLAKPFISSSLSQCFLFKGWTFWYGALPVVIRLSLLFASSSSVYTVNANRVRSGCGETELFCNWFFFQVLLSSQNVANGCNAASKAVPWWYTAIRDAYFSLLDSCSRKGGKKKEEKSSLSF